MTATKPAFTSRRRRALLTSKTGGTCEHIDADLRDPDTIVREAARTLDPTQPAALILVAILHFIADADDPAAWWPTWSAR